MQRIGRRQSGRGLRKEPGRRIRAILFDRVGICERVGVSPALGEGLEPDQVQGTPDLEERATELKRMLAGLHRTLKAG